MRPSFIAAGRARAGRPLRAFALLGVLLVGWLGWRVPWLLAAIQVSPPSGPKPMLTALAPRLATHDMVIREGSVATSSAVSHANSLASAAMATPPAPAPAPSTTAPDPAPIAVAVPELPAAAPDGSAPEGLATRAYAALAAGERRVAARLFALALAGAADPRATAWQRERQLLMRRWSGDAWTLLRDPGPTGPAATPVLGGGQSGASLAYAIDPLARRPLALVTRINVASDSDGAPVAASTQAALGLRWQLRPGLSVSAERLVALGADASDDWTLRIAGGGTRRRGRLALDGYAEAGALAKGPLYAGGQARVARDLLADGGATLAAGVGAWGSVQGDRSGGAAVGRFDLGPAAALRLPMGGASLAVVADYRFRLAGKAAPGNGPSLTVSLAF